jgi:hypothetical protein
VSLEAFQSAASGLDDTLASSEKVDAIVAN